MHRTRGAMTSTSVFPTMAVVPGTLWCPAPICPEVGFADHVPRGSRVLESETVRMSTNVCPTMAGVRQLPVHLAIAPTLLAVEHAQHASRGTRVPGSETAPTSTNVGPTMVVALATHWFPASTLLGVERADRVRADTPATV